MSVICCLLGVIVASGCASDDEGTQDPASEDGANAEAGEENAANSEEATGEEQASNEEAPAEEAAPEEMQDTASALPENAPTESAEVAETVATVPAPAEAPNYDAAGRVVRFVTANGVSAHQAASASSAAAGSYAKGDIVVVTYQGAWARLDNGLYIEASSLSAKGTGRARSSLAWSSQR